MKTIALALTGLAAISAAPALAETTYLSFGLDYSELSEGGETLKTTTGTAAFEGKVNQFTYGAEWVVQKNTLDGDSVSVSEISAILGYDITSEITAFVGASGFDFEGVDVTSLTAGAEYTRGEFTVGAAYITSESEGLETDGGQVYVEFDTSILDAYLGVAFGDDMDEIYFAGLSRTGHAYDVEIDFIGFDDFDAYKMSGSYNILADVRLNAAAEYLVAGSDDVTAFSVGAGYMVADDVWLDASYENLDVNGLSVDGFGVTLSYETGGRGLRASERLTTGYDYFDALPLFAG